MVGGSVPQVLDIRPKNEDEKSAKRRKGGKRFEKDGKSQGKPKQSMRNFRVEQ